MAKLPIVVFSRESDSTTANVHSSVRPLPKPPNSFKSIISPYHYLHHHQSVSHQSVISQSSVSHQSVCWKHPTSNYHLHLFIERLLRLFGLLSVKLRLVDCFILKWVATGRVAINYKQLPYYLPSHYHHSINWSN